MLRGVVVITLLAASWQVFGQLRALQSAQPGKGVQGLERAIALDPDGAEPYFLLGVAYRDLPGFQDLGLSQQLLAKAVSLNPFNWAYRWEQASLLELAGEDDEAEAAMQRAVELNPRSGAYHWRLANFQFRQGRIDEAFESMTQAVGLEASLAEPAVALLLRTDTAFDQLESLLPTDRATLLRMLRSFVRTGLPASGDTDRLGAGLGPARAGVLAEIWQRLIDDPEPPTLDHGRFYVDYLLKSGQHDAAEEAWIELADRNNLMDRDHGPNRNAVWNSGFEQPLAGRPFGWLIVGSMHYEANTEAGSGVDGTAALRIEFLGTENVNFAGLQQLVLVETGSIYELKAKIRTEGLTTDQGVYLEVLPGSGPSLLVTDRLVGDQDWQTLGGFVEVPESVQTVVIRLRRNRSQQIDSRIAGKVWLDSVTLERKER